MRILSTVALLSTLTASALSSPAMAIAVVGGPEPIPNVCTTGVFFDGQCRSKGWVRYNLAGGARVDDYGQCPADAACDLYFTTVEEVDVADAVVTHTLTTTMVSEGSCSAGDGCLGGYPLAIEQVTTLSLDAANQKITGETVLFGGRWGFVAPVVNRSRMGHVTFTVGRTSQKVEAFDAAGGPLGGYVMSASSGGTLLEDFCVEFVNGLIADAAGGIGTFAGGAVFAVISYGVTALAADVALTGVGVPAAVGVWVAGEAFAAAAGETARMAVKSGLKVLGKRYLTESLCDLLEEAADGPTDGIDLPDDPTVTPYEGELVEIGCWECREWAQDAGESYYDAEADEWVVEEGSDVLECVRFEISFSGSDEDDDGWCD